MKRLLSFMLVVVLLCGFAGCGNTEEGNVDYVDIIANSCGHKRKDNGREASYDMVLCSLYSSKAISWAPFEYSQLKSDKLRVTDTNGNSEVITLTDDYKYAVAHIRSEKTSGDLIFAYDPVQQKVIDGFAYGEEGDFYYSSWWIEEANFCYYYCHCSK